MLKPQRASSEFTHTRQIPCLSKSFPLFLGQVLAAELTIVTEERNKFRLLWGPVGVGNKERGKVLTGDVPRGWL